MRVLVVEDEPRLGASLRTGLQAEGYAVDLAVDGREGLWFAGENQYDVMLLDIMLPRVNGYDVCRTLRTMGDWTPVLMLTAKDGEWDQVDALDLGADDYVTKPFSFDVLLARIRSLVRRGARERPTTMRVGDLELDPAAKLVTRGDQVVSLTARELSLLEYLMRQRGQVVSKQQILDNIWAFDFEGESNIVEVYVARLRRKVDKPFGREDIETVRGLGYRIRERA
jgi:two-component system, OmpR family, response regulator